MGRTWCFNFHCANKTSETKEIYSFLKVVIASEGKAGQKPRSSDCTSAAVAVGTQPLGLSSLAHALAFVRNGATSLGNGPGSTQVRKQRRNDPGSISQRKAPRASDTRRGTELGQTPNNQECHLLSHDGQDRRETEDRSSNVPTSSRPRGEVLPSYLS